MLIRNNTVCDDFEFVATTKSITECSLLVTHDPRCFRGSGYFHTYRTVIRVYTDQIIYGNYMCYCCIKKDGQTR